MSFAKYIHGLRVAILSLPIAFGWFATSWLSPATGASVDVPYRALGVRYPNSPAKIKEYENWLGGRVDIVHIFLLPDSWAKALDGVRWNCRLHKGQPYRLLVSLPLAFGSGNARTASTGTYDSKLRELGKLLVGCGRENSIIRIGWEFNGPWFKWSALEDPEGWKKSWRRIVRHLRSVSGQKFVFDWTISRGGGGSPQDAYPGDAYVDIIGMDLYDRTYNSKWSDPSKRWNDYLNGRAPYTIGMKWHRDFAAAHGKLMSFPEFALSMQHVSTTNPDNTLFVKEMHNWIHSNNVAYFSYFQNDTAKDQHRLMTGNFPNAARTYTQLFGSSSLSVPTDPATARTEKGLVALFPLEERKGSIIHDESNRQRRATQSPNQSG